MKKTSQQYLNSEAHGYLMEAKACKLLLKDLERIRAKLRRHIEKEAADREAEFEAAMQYHSKSDIQEAYGWEFISEQQYERYLELFRQGRRALDEHSPAYSIGNLSANDDKLKFIGSSVVNALLPKNKPGLFSNLFNDKSFKIF